MIPIFVILKFKPDGMRWWLPLFLLWLLCLPVALLILPFFFLFCLIGKRNPLPIFSVVWEILRALRGTVVEVEHSSHALSIQIV